MDFEKIYADFEAARAVYDLERMSEIITQVNIHCSGLAANGRGNEIPQSAVHIANHIKVLIYHALELLSAGNGARAKYYMVSLAQDDLSGFDRFFNMLYILGRTFYTTGDYSSAEKIFSRYENIRAQKWQDVDELSLFYRANCLAMLGDFNAAARLYEQILAIKADFPEVKRNLEILQRGSTKKFFLELNSLWNFPNWRDVPIFINARDRLAVMKKMIDWLLDAGYRKIFILDNDSTYPPLLEYYRALESDRRVKIIRLGKNFGYKALWLSNVLEQLKISTPYVYTDPDLMPVEDCPKDFVRRLMKLLDGNHELRKVGLGLVWEDITFFNREYIQRIESNYYDGTCIADGVYYTQLDTTFALYSNARNYSLQLSLRTTGDLRAYHLPWYFDYDNLPDDEKYYMAHADNSPSMITQLKKQRGGS